MIYYYFIVIYKYDNNCVKYIGKLTTSVEKTQIEKNRTNKINVILGSFLLVAIVSAIILGITLPGTTPYSLEILRRSALLVLAAVVWRDVFNAAEQKEDKEHVQYR
ncbi:MAG: hypothetical protein PV340_03380 [Wolbachia sp.]|nr:hypothetical protein [Wolbachia sp.]